MLQGDREKQLGIACSPLCDRQTTLVEKSQIGFINFIVEPSFNVLGEMMEKIIEVFYSNQNSGDNATHPLTIIEDVEHEPPKVKSETSNNIPLGMFSLIHQ